jgi:hypothetical protein
MMKKFPLRLVPKKEERENKEIHNCRRLQLEHFSAIWLLIISLAELLNERESFFILSSCYRHFFHDDVRNGTL